MQHHSSIGSAAHAGIRNTDHVGHTFSQEFRRQRHVPHLRHTWVATRTAVLEHHHATLIDIQSFVIDSRMKFFNGFEYYGSPAMLQQMWTCGRWLYHGSIRRKIAAQNRDSSIRLERISEMPNHIAIPTRCIRNILPDLLPIHSQRVPAE